MTAKARLQQAAEHGWAVLFGYAWRNCAHCGRWWGDQHQPTTDHFETIPGGEDDNHLICPACTDAGVGCEAHAGTWHHDDCEYVEDEVWPDLDESNGDHREGPYLLPADGVKPSPHPRKELVRPIEVKLPEPKAVAQLNSRAAQRRIREAGQRARVIAAHRDLIAAIPDVDSNATLRQLLEEHKPTLDPADPDRLMCKGCAPAEPYTPQSEENYPARAADAPCPTWSTIFRLHRRSA